MLLELQPFVLGSFTATCSQNGLLSSVQDRWLHRAPDTGFIQVPHLVGEVLHGAPLGQPWPAAAGQTVHFPLRRRRCPGWSGSAGRVSASNVVGLDVRFGLVGASANIIF